VAAEAADPEPVPYVGRFVAGVLDDIRASGIAIVYSSRLVPPDLRVTIEPIATNALAIAEEILRPHELTLRADTGIFLVVRIDRDVDVAALHPAPSVDVDPVIENITVSASRYEISRDVSASRFNIDKRTIQNMPDLGEDPVRIAHRLPGAAASGASARAHFRGGEQSEVGIVLNGHRLFDPFHVRDYQNIFSAIDSRAIPRL